MIKLTSAFDSSFSLWKITHPATCTYIHTYIYIYTELVFHSVEIFWVLELTIQHKRRPGMKNTKQRLLLSMFLLKTLCILSKLIKLGVVWTHSYSVKNHIFIYFPQCPHCAQWSWVILFFMFCVFDYKLICLYESCWFW